MKASRLAAIRMASIVCLLASLATTASAQATARVTRDQSTIWQPDFRAAAAVVKTGTILTVVGRRDDWYEVLIPAELQTTDLTRGFIFKSSVDVSGRAPSSRSTWPTPARRPESTGTHSVGVVGIGQFGYSQFSAQRTFEAVLGKAQGNFFGGGAEVRIKNGLFVNASVERFTKTGERVFVADQQVFKLGIPDTITLTPMTLTAGWRFANDYATPYAGAGIGRVLYKEVSSFADASENVDTRFTSYHMLGGIEFRNGWLATAFEVHSRVPDALRMAARRRHSRSRTWRRRPHQSSRRPLRRRVRCDIERRIRHRDPDYRFSGTTNSTLSLES
jgi:opacity protein-like surface antigen